MAKTPAKIAAPAPSFIKQSNALTMAAYSLSMPAKRVLAVCLAEMTAQDAKMGAALIDFHLYKKHFPSSDSRVSADLRAGLTEILHSSLRFPSKTPGFENRYIPWLHSIDGIEEDSPNAMFGVLFHEEVYPHITALEQEFTYYDLKHCGKFSSTNQMRLYECLCQFRKTGLWTISSRDFIHGGIFKLGAAIKKNAYMVKIKFIEKALPKINENTPLFVTFTDEDGQFIFSILTGKAAETAKANAKKKPIEGKGAPAGLPPVEGESAE